MIPVFDSFEWQTRMDAIARPGAEHILAFYDHRLGAICHDVRRMVLPLDDHLAHRGDGVFETIRFAEGKLCNLDAHVARLFRSAAGLFMEPPCPPKTVKNAIIAVTQAGGQPDGSVRVLVGRGPGGFDIDPAECPQTTLYIVAYRGNVHSEAWYAKGLTACRSDVPVRPAMFAKLKTTNYLPGVLMTMEATRKGADIAFSFDAENCLAEAAVANVVIVDPKGVLVIPEFRNALPGTTVRKAAELAAPLMPVETRRIPEDELFTAREILVLGTAHECVAAISYEGTKIGNGTPGATAHTLRKLIREDLLQAGTPFLSCASSTSGTRRR